LKIMGTKSLYYSLNIGPLLTVPQLYKQRVGALYSLPLLPSVANDKPLYFNEL
jgi:hypothetical protein